MSQSNIVYVCLYTFNHIYHTCCVVIISPCVIVLINNTTFTISPARRMIIPKTNNAIARRDQMSCCGAVCVGTGVALIVGDCEGDKDCDGVGVQLAIGVGTGKNVSDGEKGLDGVNCFDDVNAPLAVNDELRVNDDDFVNTPELVNTSDAVANSADSVKHKVACVPLIENSTLSVNEFDSEKLLLSVKSNDSVKPIELVNKFVPVNTSGVIVSTISS